MVRGRNAAHGKEQAPVVREHHGKPRRSVGRDIGNQDRCPTRTRRAEQSERVLAIDEIAVGKEAHAAHVVARARELRHGPASDGDPLDGVGLRRGEQEPVSAWQHERFGRTIGARHDQRVNVVELPAEQIRFSTALRSVENRLAIRRDGQADIRGKAVALRKRHIELRHGSRRI